MDILILAAFGALIGAAASFVMGTSGGLIADVVVGILGSVIGGWIMQYFGSPVGTGLTMYSFLVGLLGACVLIIVVRIIPH
jgi:uncharacterized membrane protein YeaQ/YmgE (transglycosylase-associated protein family)